MAEKKTERIKKKGSPGFQPNSSPHGLGPPSPHCRLPQAPRWRAEGARRCHRDDEALLGLPWPLSAPRVRPIPPASFPSLVTQPPLLCVADFVVRSSPEHVEAPRTATVPLSPTVLSRRTVGLVFVFPRF